MAANNGLRVRSEPYSWPFDGNLKPENTALIIIDMQVDFCQKGGYVDQMGYDLSLVQAPIKPIQRVLAACREMGYFVIHTREGHRPDLLDLPANKKWRSEQIGAGIGSKGPAGRILIRGEQGWDIIDDLKPIEGEPIIDKPGKGSFYATDLDLILETKGIRNIVLTGVTTDVCVHTTMRDANDRGYECLLLSDCTAATDYGNHLAAQKMIKMQGGVFGAVATSDMFIAAIHPKAAGLMAPLSDGISERTVVVCAQPYKFDMPVAHTALIMIDFQVDFMIEGGYGHKLGNDVKLLQEAVEPAKKLLSAAREHGIFVVHTAEAHSPDLSDAPPSKLKRGNSLPGSRIGDEGELGRILVRGEPGNQIIEELAPLPEEKVLHKPGKGAFYSTDLQSYLQGKGITHILFAGVTTEVCVQTSMREANDRGYECLLVTDACASYYPQFHDMTVAMITSQGGIVGWKATADDIISALSSS